MKARFSILAFLFVTVQYCNRHVAEQGFPQQSYNVLLQESHGGLSYIFLRRDTAYFEQRQIDKPFYFTGFDTLVRIKDSEWYEGKQTRMLVNTREIRLQFLSGRNASKSYYFSVASVAQIQKYDGYKNQDRYSRLYPTVDKMIWGTPRTAFHEKLKQDWEKLRDSIATMSQDEFEVALNNLKTVYSISE